MAECDVCYPPYRTRGVLNYCLPDPHHALETFQTLAVAVVIAGAAVILLVKRGHLTSVLRARWRSCTVVLARISFRAACGARPRVYLRFPSSYDAGDSIGACGELAIRRTDVVMTYEVSTPRRA